MVIRRVPDTETFSLEDVWDAVVQHENSTNRDLQDCFNNAESTYFHPSYNNNSYAPANSMKRFRKYGPPYCHVSDQTYLNQFSTTTLPTGLWFNATGTVMFVLANYRTVYKYYLSTAWDITTASLDGSKTLTSGKSYASLFFDPDGDAFFTINTTDSRLEKWKMTIGFNLNYASYDSNFNFSSWDIGIRGVSFNPSGTRMLMVGNEHYETAIYQFNLGTGFNFGSVSMNHSIQIAQTKPLTGVFFNSDGKRIYIAQQASSLIREWKLSTAYELSTAYYECIGLIVNTHVNDGTRPSDIFVNEYVDSEEVGYINVFFTDVYDMAVLKNKLEELD
jgi:hypothetical protein